MVCVFKDDVLACGALLTVTCDLDGISILNALNFVSCCNQLITVVEILFKFGKLTMCQILRSFVSVNPLLSLIT